MSARTPQGQYTHGDHWDRQRAAELRLQEKARRHAIARTHAHLVTDPAQGGRVVALCREWGVPCPPFANLPPLPEVYFGVFANTDDIGIIAALLETM